MELAKINANGTLDADTTASLQNLDMASRWWLAWQLSGKDQGVHNALYSDAEVDAGYRDQQTVGGRDCQVLVFADGSAINYTNGEDDVYPDLDTMAEKCEGATREERDDSMRGYRTITMSGWAALLYDYPALRGWLESHNRLDGIIADNPDVAEATDAT